MQSKLYALLIRLPNERTMLYSLTFMALCLTALLIAYPDETPMMQVMQANSQATIGIAGAGTCGLIAACIMTMTTTKSSGTTTKGSGRRRLTPARRRAQP